MNGISTVKSVNARKNGDHNRNAQEYFTDAQRIPVTTIPMEVGALQKDTNATIMRDGATVTPAKMRIQQSHLA